MKYYMLVILYLFVPFDSTCQDNISRIGECENRRHAPDSLIFEDMYIRRGDTIFAITYYPRRIADCYKYHDTIYLIKKEWVGAPEKNHIYKYNFRKTRKYNDILKGSVYCPYKIRVYDMKGNRIYRRFFVGRISLTRFF